MIPKILVVDNNDSITLLLSITLKTEGCDVETAADGMEAFQKFQLNEPDVLVTDLVMPEMDVQALCRRVRKISSVPILIITPATWADTTTPTPSAIWGPTEPDHTLRPGSLRCPGQKPADQLERKPVPASESG